MNKEPIHVSTTHNCKLHTHLQNYKTRIYPPPPPECETLCDEQAASTEGS
jgi:hypothetical protein